MLKHIAIIMDGNGRWANARRLPRLAGHRKGADAARAAIETCAKLGVRYLTLYAFSAENWQRPQEEVNGLMELLQFYLNKELKSLHENNIRVRFIGDLSLLSPAIQRQLSEAEALTENNERLDVIVALSYGSRQELADALNRIVADKTNGRLNGAALTPELIDRYIYTSDIPDPDLLIRTGGEQRLSNFLLWQSAYAELYFTDTLWPDFDKEALENAIADFHSRERRFGRAEETVECG